MTFQGTYFDEFLFNLCDWIHDTWGEVRFKFDEDKEEIRCEPEERESEAEVKEESQKKVSVKQKKGKPTPKKTMRRKSVGSKRGKK